MDDIVESVVELAYYRASVFKDPAPAAGTEATPS
jgi:oligoribonuclease (3'-5' exoribonuclease)